MALLPSLLSIENRKTQGQLPVPKTNKKQVKGSKTEEETCETQRRQLYVMKGDAVDKNKDGFLKRT